MDLRPWAYAHWHLNEVAGNTVTDSSGNTRHGTRQNMEDGDWQVGKLNNCLLFDGIDEFVNFGQIAGFERTDSFSVELWFKSTSSGQKTLCAKMNQIVPFRGWSVSLDSGKISIWMVNTYPTNQINVLTTSSTWCNGAWHHLVVTYNGSSSGNGILIYVDNVLQTKTMPSNTLNATILTTEDLNLASRKTIQFFPGNIDEVCIYTKALSVAEITWRWNSSVGREGLADNLSPPAVPNTPIPPNHTIDCLLTQTIGWSCSDPDPGDVLTYDVYFGDSNPPPKVATDQIPTTYNPGLLNYNTQYFWKIVARDSGGLTTEGPIWDFTTKLNLPPTTPYNPNPNDGATDCPHNQNLSWLGGHPSGDPVVYDLYYGITSPPAIYASNLPVSSYTLPPNKPALQKYYWKIVSRNVLEGTTTTGPIWNFTTKNESPETPTLPLPSNLAINQATSLTLGWTCSDLNLGDVLTYDIYFGLSSSPPLIKINHGSTAYSVSGLAYDTTYFWQIVAKDNHGATTASPVWQFSVHQEFATLYEVFEPRELVRNAITTQFDINEDGTSENVMTIIDSNHNTFKIPIYLTEETKSIWLPSLPFIELGLLHVNSAPQDIMASTRKNEAYIDINIYYTTMDNVDPVDLGKKICDKIISYIRNYQSTTTGIHFMNITNTSKVFVETYGKQVVFHRNMELYCLFYDRP